MRPCAVEGCKRPVQHGHLMCREHWRRVPRDMQGEVNDAWKVYRRAILTTPPDAKTTAKEKIDLANRYRFVTGEAARIAGEKLP